MKLRPFVFERRWDSDTVEWRPNRRENRGWAYERILTLQPLPWNRGFMIHFELIEKYEVEEHTEDETWSIHKKEQLWQWDFYDRDAANPFDACDSIRALWNGDARNRIAENLAHSLYVQFLQNDKRFPELMPGVAETKKIFDKVYEPYYKG